MTDYDLLLRQAEALTEGFSYKTANLANISALLFETLKDINWSGFYFIEDGALVLNAFQGKPACVVLAKGKGVCWRAVIDQRPVNVPDVHLFPGHIACDSASRSEIVLPLLKDGKAVGVLDIDSPIANRFDKTDEIGLSRLAKHIETLI